MLPSEELDRQYSPRQWTKRFNGDRAQIINWHYKEIRSGSEAARSSLAHDLTGKYGPNLSDVFHVYGTDLSEDSPVCVYVHGGYWQVGCAIDHAFAAVPLHKVDYKLVVFGHELSPIIDLTEIVQRTTQFVQVLLAQFPKARHFTLIGHCSGAHLVLCALMHLAKAKTLPLDRIKYLFLLSGIYDLREVRHTKINANNKLGLDEDTAHQLSPLVAFDFTIWSGLSMLINVVRSPIESPPFDKQAIELHEKLQTAGLHSALIVINGCDHFDIVERMSDETFEMTRLIMETSTTKD